MYSLDQEKRSLCPYDDKRYLLANLPDGSPNPNTRAYGHKDLTSEERLVADMPETPGNDLIIEHQERRFNQRHQRVVKKLWDMAGAKEELEAEKQEAVLKILHNSEEWVKAAREAASRPGIAGRITEVIDRLSGAGQPISDLSQRAESSGTNQPIQSLASSLRDSSDDDYEERQDPIQRTRKRPKNPFILDEAIEADDDDNDLGEEKEEEIGCDYDDYEFIDDV